MLRNRLMLYRNPARGCVEFYLRGDEGQAVYYAKPVTMASRESDAYMVDPCFTMSDDDAQAFIDQLWRDGFRPTKTESQGAYDAQGRHLEDMRRIAFRFLEDNHDRD